ncbi:hypothetical protein HYPSUDRAFT_129104 [Hypholoma sublateritium FD-334 SS-4]|uniref:Palmitoyltransferase PFA4 n=1 Tax=Hypholoma sublateritium (strain FD-334 SS-4) TaxID=945553 RepID=A0A0D2PCB1_HYPSF|nr:hypothetical protein HYPSUDRAFT_129104 [Hypholoma sublateritium FD-334 SS-4]
MSSFLGRLIVNFVLCLISFIAYSSQIFIIWPWYGSVLSVELITLLLPFNILVGLLLWNYFLCVFTDPGRVPNGWKPDTHTDGYEVKKLTGALRFCRMCNNYKPPRAHHCRQCNRCVLRMDHHCPWINNCVGHFNYGHFIRFLFFVDLACSYHLIMVTKRVFYYSNNSTYWDEPSTVELVMLIMNYVACVPVLLSVGIFSIYHIYSLLGNSTTIEGWEKDKRSIMVKKGRAREIKSAYDLGAISNIKSILGPRPVLWCCPTTTPGTGLKYSLSNAEGEFISLSREILPPAELDSDSADEAVNISDDASPWTIADGSLNPDLHPSNTALRGSVNMRRRRPPIPGASSLPPYHPNYQEEYSTQQSQPCYESSDDEDYDGPSSKVRVRRGSEGYEIRPESREQMLREYLESLGEQPDRYLRYIPQVEGDFDTDEDDDDVPLGHISKFADTVADTVALP